MGTTAEKRNFGRVNRVIPGCGDVAMAICEVPQSLKDSHLAVMTDTSLATCIELEGE